MRALREASALLKRSSQAAQEKRDKRRSDPGRALLPETPSLCLAQSMPEKSAPSSRGRQRVNKQSQAELRSVRRGSAEGAWAAQRARGPTASRLSPPGRLAWISQGARVSSSIESRLRVRVVAWSSEWRLFKGQ